MARVIFPQFKKGKQGSEFNKGITKDISISQQDIYQLIAAKAGLRTDQNLLMKYYGVNLDQSMKMCCC